MARVRANQKAESPVSTRPLSGISVGRTTSKVEIRSEATRSSRSSSRAYSSRTLPLPRCTASVMEAVLLSAHCSIIRACLAGHEAAAGAVVLEAIGKRYGPRADGSGGRS